LTVAHEKVELPHEITNWKVYMHGVIFGWILRLILCGALVSSVSGCDKFNAVFASNADKITNAFPPSGQIQSAFSRLTAASDDKFSKELQEQYEKRVQLRALNCAANLSVGRFETSTDIEKKITNPSCFKEQDVLLQDWVAQRTLIVLLAQAPLGASQGMTGARLLPAGKERTYAVTATAGADVVVLRGVEGTFTAMQLSNGNVVKAFEIKEVGSSKPLLSPNGRILVLSLPSEKGLRFVDVERGETVWVTERFKTLVEWLPEVNALVLRPQKEKNISVLLDLYAGSTSNYSLPEPEITWATTGKTDSSLFIGGPGSASVIHHSRKSDGVLESKVIQQWALNLPVVGGEFFTMESGQRLVYVSFDKLAWLKLSDGTQGKWDFGGIGIRNVAKLDEQSLILSSRVLDQGKNASFVFDLLAETLSPANINESSIVPLLPRVGYVLSKGGILSVNTKLELGAPEPLSQLVGKLNLESQIKKLQEIAVKEVQMPPPQVVVPLDSYVAAIGVYEAENSIHGIGIERKAGDIRVMVEKGTTPLVLVLTNNEPINWRVTNKGRKIAAVLLSGSHPSEVTGINAPVYRLGRTNSYEFNSGSYMQLSQEVRQYIGLPLKNFQGVYKGKAFAVAN
jgi:hypothetical protein